MNFLNKKQRALTIDEKRHVLFLAECEWAALDLLAGHTGQKWPALVTSLIDSYPDEAERNLTGLIRLAIVNNLLMASTAQDRVNLPESPLLELSAMFNDEELTEDLGKAKHYGSADMGGFTLMAGADQFDRPCLWVQNNHRDGMHVAIPLTVEQLQAFKGA